jgi:hypothetical protein
MLSLRDESFRIILSEAEERGVSVQELLRAVIVPEWVKENMSPSTVPQLGKEVTPRLTRALMPVDPDPFIKVTLARPRT